jgi:hypothetical protein
MADLFSRALDMILGMPSRKVPKEILLSSQYLYTFKIGDKYFPLIDIDSISKTLKVEQKKSFKPFGYTHQMTLTNHLGWDIKITGKKANDGVLEQFIQSIIELNNNSETIYPKGSAPYGANPTIDLIERVAETNLIDKKLDDLKEGQLLLEWYTYRELVLTGFDQDVPEDNSPITYTLSFFAKKREQGKSQVESELVTDMVKAINQAIADNSSYKYEGPGFQPTASAAKAPSDFA